MVPVYCNKYCKIYYHTSILKYCPTCEFCSVCVIEDFILTQQHCTQHDLIN